MESGEGRGKAEQVSAGVRKRAVRLVFEQLGAARASRGTGRYTWSVYSWFTLVGAGGTALAALGLALNRFRERRPIVARATVQVVGAASHEAEQRGHRPLTVTPLALALPSDPYVARELERRSVSLKQLYTDVEGLLPPRGDSPIKLLPTDIEPSLEALLRRSGRRRMSAPDPMAVLHTLLRSEHDDVRAVFERHGLTSERWPPPSARPADSKLPVAPDGESGPYRGPPTGNATTDVIFWNDKKTTQEFVTQVLRGTFGVVEPEATRLVLSVDQDGFAVVGIYERVEAERLARTAMRLAKEQGYPLRVSTEEAGGTNAMSSSERWLRRS